MKQGGWSVQRGQDRFPRGHPGAGGAGRAAAERGRGEAIVLPETSSWGGTGIRLKVSPTPSGGESRICRLGT